MNAPAPQATTSTSPGLPRRRRHWPFWVAGVLLLLLALPAILVWWIGSDGSLERALRTAQRFLPADQVLVFEDVHGSITSGGSIALIEWERPGLALRIEGLSLDWSLRQLRDRDLRIRMLLARRVQVRLSPVPEPPPEEPFVMPDEITLPVKLTVPLAIGRLEIQSTAEDGSANTQVIEQVGMGYRFNGEHHALRLEGVQYGQSHAQAQALLHAHELTLQLRAAAAVRDPVPGIPLAMLVGLQADGGLKEEAGAPLTLRLDAREQAAEWSPELRNLLEEARPLAAQGAAAMAEGADGAGQPAFLHLQATAHPWREQPLEDLALQAHRLDAGAFHASAPRTLIDTEATVQPGPGRDPQEWNLQLMLRNAVPAAWDRGGLPIALAELRGVLSTELAVIEEARVELAGAAPAGVVQLAGRLPLGEPLQPTLDLQLQGLNLQPLLESLPETRLDGQVTVDRVPEAATAGTWHAKAELRNALAGPLDVNRLPLDLLEATIDAAPGRVDARQIALQVGEGSLQASGTWEADSRAVRLQASMRGLPLRRIHRDLAGGPAELGGELTVAGDLERGLRFDADIGSNAAAQAGADAPRAQWELRQVQAEGRWTPARLQVTRVHLDAFGATVDGSGIDVTLPDLDAIQADVTAAAPGLALDADADMRRQSGGGTLALRLESADELLAWLHELPLVGESLPAIEATGAAHLDAAWQGGWRQWVEGFARPARHPGLRMDIKLAAQGFHVELPGSDETSALVLDVDSFDATAQGNLAAASLAINGDLRLNDVGTDLDVQIDMKQAAAPARAPAWQFNVQQLHAAAILRGQAEPWQLQVSDGLQVDVATGAGLELRATAGMLTLSPPAGTGAPAQNLELAWEPLLWRKAGEVLTVQSKGTVSGLQPGWLDQLRLAEPPGPLENAGVRTDLVIGGEWNLQLDEALTVDVHLHRDAGDVWLLGPALSGELEPLQPRTEEGTAAGLRTFDVRVQSADEEVSLALEWDTANAGAINARAATRLERESGGWSFGAAAPLSGNVQARLEDMGVWGFFAPPGWRMQGRLQADIQLAGTLQQPELRGPVEGSGMNIRSVLDGVELHEGTLRAAFEGRRLRLEELAFQGGTGSKAYVPGISGNRTQAPGARGSMRATGQIDWSGVGAAAPGYTGIAVDLEARLERMQVLVRNDRQLSLSGELRAALAEGALRVRGELSVDRATILLPEAGAATLGDDVIVLRGDEPLEAVEALAVDGPRGGLQATRRMDVELSIDLGRDLALHGQGITTRLEGELIVRSSTNPGQPFAVFGEVRTDEGRYRAWGQALNVETGIVAFNGSYTNPALNLLAIRPEIEVRAGVRVTGTLLAPRVELYSDPPLPESEKLSWVVLGRATAIGEGEGTSMQRAALGLLAGRAVSSLSDDLGVDELGLDDSALSIGKRISDELYVTYEAGLSGAASTLYVFYDLTRRLTLRGETGEASALDLIYTIDYD
ncbi:MAG: translocation/assembly module TamB domain-containing protein [Pseudomonadota bacterium]|nr:translocation/assembly module TamB domain-containing protein [Pseudomonadota bacterium]